MGNTIIEASYYDTIAVNWTNPYNEKDQVSGSFPVKPAPKIAKVYFADENWKELTQSLNGTENMLYVVVEDAVFDPTRLDEYVVTLSNKKGEGNTSPADREVYKLQEITPGKYGITVSVNQSPPVQSGNGSFEIRIGDELKVSYVNPITQTEYSDIIGYGVPTQMPGQVMFTNKDWSMPTALMAGGIWDAGSGNVYITYSDDYIPSVSVKQALVSIVNTDALGRKFSDTELISLRFIQKQGELGIWGAAVELADSPVSISGDGILQLYFKGKIMAIVATHLNGSAEILEGDSAKASLITARGNSEENLKITDPINNLEPGRSSSLVQVCVTDQVFSEASVDTVLLDKIECASSGDRLEDIALVQTSLAEGKYCATVLKEEAVSGTLTDDILHCQDIDNIVVVYRDPIYGTEATGQVTIMDPTITRIGFYDLQGNPVSNWSEAEGNQLAIRLTAKSPGLYTADTLKVKLQSDSGDSLDVLVYETAVNSGVFEGLFYLGFGEEINLRNNIIEGTLNLVSAFNSMIVTVRKGNARSSLTIEGAYVPVKRAWIVDGNSDGQADSIYISFAGVITELPKEITSIDWNGEGLQGYSASYNILDPLQSEIGYVNGDLSTIAVLLPGVLDKSLSLFPQGVTAIDNANPPELTLPDGIWFQGQSAVIEDGIGPVVVSATKSPSDDSYYKDAEGYLQKQPDTLVITLSEKIRPLHSAGNPWDSLFLFMSPNMERSDAYPLISISGFRPQVQGPDSLVWTFIVDNGSDNIKPRVNDLLFLNPAAPYADASPAANTPQGLPQTITGVENPNPINNSNIFVPVTGSSLADPRSISANLYIDGNGKVLLGRDVVMVTNEDGGYSYARHWVKPVGLQNDGTVSPSGDLCGSGIIEIRGNTEYPENCLSTVQVLSTDRYMAEITIFDHLGKFVHQSIQSFGYCGELENPVRRSPQGLKSWLVWNQKDLQENYVGSGVYIWRVKFTSSSGKYIGVYRQGIVRAGIDPENNCAQ
ncbi:MAG: hypothetical protein HQK83_17600 [Fibrobacteria bacterium]|nr:hypothetical protein [Fibrobacteria bacterium]